MNSNILRDTILIGCYVNKIVIFVLAILSTAIKRRISQ